MDNILQPGSKSDGKRIEYADTINVSKWHVPSYLQTLPIDVCGEIMYSVHAILENIQISASDYTEVLMNYRRLSEKGEFRAYLSGQLSIMKEKIH